MTKEWVAGVDGCRAGWVAVLHERGTGNYDAYVLQNFQQVLSLSEAPRVVAVDVPIGLLSAARAGGRECEVLARQLLGRRKSSVFSAPTRAALLAFRAGAGCHQAISTANRGGVPSAPGITLQTFAILPKIDEADRALAPQLQRKVVEVHPELCFAEANRGRPMVHSKKRSAGRTERVTLLRTLGFVSALQLLGTKIPKGVSADDLFDACIACWTADRIAAGRGIVIPNTPPKDRRRLRTELWR